MTNGSVSSSQASSNSPGKSHSRVPLLFLSPEKGKDGTQMLALTQPEDGDPLVPMFVGGGMCFSGDTLALSEGQQTPYPDQTLLAGLL